MSVKATRSRQDIGGNVAYMVVVRINVEMILQFNQVSFRRILRLQDTKIRALRQLAVQNEEKSEKHTGAS